VTCQYRRVLRNCRQYKQVAISYSVFQTISEAVYAEFFKRYQNNIASKFQRSSFLVFAQLFDLTEKRSLICGSWCYVFSAFLLTTLWDIRDVVRILKLKSLKLCMRKSNKSRINKFSHSLFFTCISSSYFTFPRDLITFLNNMISMVFRVWRAHFNC